MTLKAYTENKEIEKTFEIKIEGFTFIKNFIGKDFPQQTRNELKLYTHRLKNPPKIPEESEVLLKVTLSVNKRICPFQTAGAAVV